MTERTAEEKAEAVARFAERHARAMQANKKMDDANRTILSARNIGLLSMASVGWRLWAKEAGLDMRVDADGEGHGGIIVEIVGARTVTADGEISDTRAFRCADPYTAAWVTLPEASVDVNRIMTVDRRETRILVSRIAEAELVIRKGARTKSLLESEPAWFRAIADIARLGQALTVGGRL